MTGESNELILWRREWHLVVNWHMAGEGFVLATPAAEPGPCVAIPEAEIEQRLREECRRRKSLRSPESLRKNLHDRG